MVCSWRMYLTENSVTRPRHVEKKNQAKLMVVYGNSVTPFTTPDGAIYALLSQIALFRLHVPHA